MDKDTRRSLKNIGKRKWSNPNSFTAIISIVAFLMAILAFFVLEIAIKPIIQYLYKLGIGYYTLNCFATIISQGVIFLIAFLFCKIFKVRLFGGGGLKFSFDFASCVPALALSIGTFFLISPTHMQFATYIEELKQILFGSTTELPEVDFNFFELSSLFTYIFVLVPVLPAICEEALFRGVIMNGLREFGTIFAIFTSGLLFAIMHGNFSQLLLQFVIGCEMAFVVIITGNYFPAMVMHFANNLFSVVYAVCVEIFATISPAFGIVLELFATIIAVGLVCFAIIYYFKLSEYKKDNSKNENSKFLFYKKNKYYPCCLLEKGKPIHYCFAVNHELVISNSNEGFLFFANGKFNKFKGRSNKTAFWIIFAISVGIAVGLIFFDFFR